MGAPKPVIRIEGYDSDGDAATIEAERANRVLAFDTNFSITKNTASDPERIDIALAADGIPLQISTLQEQVSALTARVTALEAKQFVPTAIKTANYTAVAWEHVLVDLVTAAGNVTITMPTSPAPSVGDRVKVSDVSATGGVGAAKNLLVAATFATVTGGHYAVSPYAIGDVGAGETLKGATAELIYVGTGWLVTLDTVEPEALA
jgi:hypothetical protein